MRAIVIVLIGLVVLGLGFALGWSADLVFGFARAH